jgi:hypothetical protein
MPLAHLLWRLAEKRTAPVPIRVTTACRWPACGLERVDLLSLLDPQAPKSAEARCPFCRRPMRIQAGAVAPEALA